VQGEVLPWQGDEVTPARRGSGDAVHGEVTAVDVVARRRLDGGVVTAQARCFEAKRARRRGRDGVPVHGHDDDGVGAAWLLEGFDGAVLWGSEAEQWEKKAARMEKEQRRA